MRLHRCLIFILGIYFVTSVGKELATFFKWNLKWPLWCPNPSQMEATLTESNLFQNLVFILSKGALVLKILSQGYILYFHLATFFERNQKWFLQYLNTSQMGATLTESNLFSEGVNSFLWNTETFKKWVTGHLFPLGMYPFPLKSVTMIATFTSISTGYENCLWKHFMHVVSCI